MSGIGGPAKSVGQSSATSSAGGGHIGSSGVTSHSRKNNNFINSQLSKVTSEKNLIVESGAAIGSSMISGEASRLSPRDTVSHQGSLGKPEQKTSASKKQRLATTGKKVPMSHQSNF